MKQFYYTAWPNFGVPNLLSPSSGKLATSGELQMDWISCTAGEKLSVSTKLHQICLGPLL